MNFSKIVTGFFIFSMLFLLGCLGPSHIPETLNPPINEELLGECGPEVEGIDYSFFPAYKINESIRVDYAEDDATATFPHRVAEYCLITQDKEDYEKAIVHVKSSLKDIGYSLCEEESYSFGMNDYSTKITTLRFSDESYESCRDGSFEASGRTVVVDIKFINLKNGNYKLYQSFVYDGLDDEELPSLEGG